MNRECSFRQGNILSFAVLCLLLIGNLFFLKYNAFRYFHFYDMCFSLDGGWRILKGQKPYIDFIYFSGPIHLYLHALFFKLFGFGKTAVWVHLWMVNSIVVVFVYLLTYRWMPFYLTFLVAVLTTTSFYWPVSHPWHDQSTHLWGIVGIAYLSRRIPFTKPSQAFQTGLFCGVMAVLSFMTKINIGMAYLVLFALVCLVSDQRKNALLGYGIGLGAALIVMRLLITDPKAYIDQIVTYGQLTRDQRLSGFLQISKWLSNYYWFPLVIVGLNICAFVKPLKEWIILFIGTFVVAIISIVSGQMIPEANVCLWGVFLGLAFILLFKKRNLIRGGKHVLLWRSSLGALIIFTFVLIGFSVKFGLDLKAWTYITGKTPVGVYAIETEPFKGWHTDPIKGQALDQFANFIKSNVPADQSLLVLSDLQILYALTGRDSYRGIPLFVFRKNHMPVPGKQLEEVSRHLREHLPDWIILDVDNYFLEIPYLGLKDIINKDYFVVFPSGPYALIRHRI